VAWLYKEEKGSECSDNNPKPRIITQRRQTIAQSECSDNSSEGSDNRGEGTGTGSQGTGHSWFGMAGGGWGCLGMVTCSAMPCPLAGCSLPPC